MLAHELRPNTSVIGRMMAPQGCPGYAALKPGNILPYEAEKTRDKVNDLEMGRLS